MITVQLYRDEYDRAIKIAERIKERRKDSVLFLPGTDDPTLTGVLGELAFEKYLKHIGADFRRHEDDTGSFGDAWDYVVNYENYGPVYFDVKTSKIYDIITVNERLALKAIKTNLILVGAKLQSGNTVVIYGHAPASELKREVRPRVNKRTGEEYFIYKIPKHAIRRFKTDDLVIY